MRTLCALLFSAAAASAQTIRITTPDEKLEARSIEIKPIAGELAVEIEDAGGRKRTLKCIDVVDVAMAPQQINRSPVAHDVQVLLRNGDTVFGSLLEPMPEGLQLQSAALGTVSYKLDHIDSVRFLINRAVWPTRRPAEESADFVVSKTLDERKAALKSISKAGVVYTSSMLKRDVTIQCADTAVIWTMAPLDPPPKPPATLHAIVQLTDGGSIQGSITSLAEGVLKLTDLYGANRSIGTASVSGIYFKNGRIAYLSDQPPATVKEEANYIRDPARTHPSDKVFPFQVDRNVRGGKLAIRGQEFRKGLGVHSRSELTWELGGAYSRFEATIGIDDVAVESECGSVIFVVIADGKKVWDSGPVTWKDAPRPVTVALAGAQQLTLLVDWGDDFERGDCADWALARVIK